MAEKQSTNRSQIQNTANHTSESRNKAEGAEVAT